MPLEEKKRIHLFCPPDHADLELHSTEQTLFLTDPTRESPHELDLVPRNVDLSLPRPQIFRWESQENAILQIAADSEFENILFELPAKVEASVYNLPAGSQCFWRVRAGEISSEVRSFTTASQPPRLIHLPDVTNVRDLGAWKAADGRRIRQGMIYRGAQFYSGRLEPGMRELSAEGTHILFQQLKIRTELDLRSEKEGGALHPALRYECIPLSAYATWGEQGIFSAEQMKRVKKIFDLLADPAVYPVYIHCAGGGDRTGTLCFLIESALGVGEEDLVTDYEYSNLSISGERSRFSEVWTAFMKKLREYPGTTSHERVVSYLKDCGISQKHLEHLQKLLLE